MFTTPKRNRKGLRPLSQTGFHHLPANPKQRVPEEGGGRRAGLVLSAFNEKQETRQLHPTKGWRGLNVKRSRAQMIIAAIHSGQSMGTAAMARFLSEGI